MPVYVQYGRWIGVLSTPDWRLTGESHFRGLLQGTFGHSLYGGGTTVEESIIGRLPVTIELGVLAIVIGLVIALPVGVYSAIRQDTTADYVGRTVAVIGLATPNFWLATMVLLYPALWWGWSPPVELIPFKEDPLGNLGMFIIPAVIPGDGPCCQHHEDDAHHDAGGAQARLYQDGLVEGAQGADSYNKTRHQECPHPGSDARRPAAPHPDRGSVILEQIFALPGIGRLFVVALDARDYPIVSAINLIFATAVLGINLMIDLIYSYLDPRIRYE